MKKVYICSPYRNDPAGNTERALEYCRLAIREGCIPMAPHLYFTRFLDEEDIRQRNLGLEQGLEWLKECEEIWVFPGEAGISEGMQAEIRLAQKKGIPIRMW